MIMIIFEYLTQKFRFETMFPVENDREILQFITQR